MKTIEQVASLIREIDCPEDKLKNKITKAYEDYYYNGESEVIIEREKSLDKNKLSAYKAFVNKEGSPTLVIMVDEGLDHYVATVQEVYLQ